MRVLAISAAVLLAAALVASSLVVAGGKVDEERLRAHYVGKMVAARIDLPRTDGGFLFVNDCEIDTESLRRAIQGSSTLGVESGGVGVPKGTTVVVGDLKIRANYIQFFLGTSKGAEWGKALDTMAGFGRTTQAGTKAEPASGAGVVIVYGAEVGDRGVRARTARPLQPEDLTIESINKCLGKVVDTRSLLSLDGLPEEQRRAVQEGRAVIGMDKRAVFLSLGEPREKKSEMSGSDVIERWLYESESLNTTLVILKNGVVTEVREF